jgi:putative tryptophan/tyrosine transport system substrate-binding protein
MRLRRTRVLLLLCIALAMPCSAAADRAHRLIVVLGADEQAYHATWDSFRHTLLRLAGPALPFDIDVITLRDGDPVRPDGDAAPPDLVIPVGARAARFARERFPATPAYNILITREAFTAIWPQDRQTAGHTAPAVSALYLEQPFDRQFRLLRLTLPAVRHASVLVGGHSRHLKPELVAAARRSNIELQIVDYASARNPVTAFSEALSLGEAVLVFPDSEVISPNHAKWLLYMAYQQQVPVIGFSGAFADAGALAALYTTPEQVGRQAAETVIDLAVDAVATPGRPWRLPAPAWPRYFNVSVNRAVARAFQIEIRDQRQLARSLMAVEGSDRWQADR